MKKNLKTTNNNSNNNLSIKYNNDSRNKLE